MTVTAGPPPGLLAFAGDLAVGWCQLTPRADLPWLRRARHIQPVDDVPVWSLSCFSVRRGYRRQGVTDALVSAAVSAAKRAKAPAFEAYPVDTDVPGSSQTCSPAPPRCSAGPDSARSRRGPRPGRSCATTCVRSVEPT
ncbi:MAG TPA: GNAT family N-acetyltransferase [Pseudonocardiaceae bacterium]|nr:GNAT family N-acetyltransferase [Pseudonocardiaceae bacterium]